MQTSFCVRTQIAKTEYLPAEYIPLIFLTRTPSPFCAGWRWGLLSRKIFFDFFSDSIINSFWLYFDSYFIFSDFRLVYPILGFQLNSFTEYPRFNSFIFARYYLDYDFWLRFWFSTRFYSLNFPRIDFDLFQHCRFYALTLQLFISSAYYKQTSMLI